MPGKSPHKSRGWKTTPKKRGVMMTSRPGGIISLKEAEVDTSMHLLKSGSYVPFLMAGLANCLLTSLTIS